MILLGIDPGKLGGIGILHPNGNAEVHKFTTEGDMRDIINAHVLDSYAYLELVHSMPGDGNVSAFSFGENFGFYRGLLMANLIPFEQVAPLKWQNFLKCRTHGDKNITKKKAQELYPRLKITHANADAILIATYGQRMREQFGKPNRGSNYYDFLA